MRKILKFLAAVTTAVTLVACGGGGSSNVTPPQIGTTPGESSYTLTDPTDVNKTPLISPIDATKVVQNGLQINVKFDQAITKGNDSVTIASSNGAVPVLSTSVSVNGDTLVIVPDKSVQYFSVSTTYTVTVGAGAVKSVNGNLPNVAFNLTPFATNTFRALPQDVSTAMATYLQRFNGTNGQAFPVTSITNIAGCTTTDTVSFLISAVVSSTDTSYTNDSGFKANGNPSCLQAFPAWSPNGSNGMRTNSYAASNNVLALQKSFLTKQGTVYTGTFEDPLPSNVWAFIGGADGVSFATVSTNSTAFDTHKVTYQITQSDATPLAAIVKVTTVSSKSDVEVARQVDTYNYNVNGISLIGIEGSTASGSNLTLGYPSAPAFAAPAP